MAWRVRKEDVEAFRKDLWKDERSFPTSLEQLSSNEFTKDCFDQRRAQVELLALRLLASGEGEKLCPSVLRSEGSTITLERVRGIRLFDLVRYLRDLELRRRDGAAARAQRLIFGRCRQRLARIQRILYEVREEIAQSPYPMEEKLSQLLNLLARVLGAETHFSRCRKQISDFSSYWRQECSLVPFRDATIKNCLIAEPRLEPIGDQTQRVARLEEILDKEGDEYWKIVPIRDVDFSSVEHLTTPEDDPISLHFHEWSDGTCSLTPEALILLPTIFIPDGYRAAASMLMRYLRFGGRKLAYKIINAQGFEVRYRYDDPLFYFKNLRERCQILSATFSEDYRAIIEFVEHLGQIAAYPMPADKDLLTFDYFRKYYPQRTDYWQETPVERQ